MEKRLIEQSDAIDAIVPYITTYYAELSVGTRPIGVFFLLGPTGVGKTATVESVAEVLHGDKKKVLRIDCGQFELSHEVAKLVGSPPGYLGHRETAGMLTTKKVDEVTSPKCDISIILFDEIEKAHANLFRNLLSVLDKGELTMGDNSVTSFKKSLIFFTSNLGAAEMQKALTQNMGFTSGIPVDMNTIMPKLESIGKQAAKKKFSPEFFNRIDEVLTYKPLSKAAIAKIFNIGIDNLRELLYNKTKPKNLFLVLAESVEKKLIAEGFSELYGARELNRVIQRQLVQPLSDVLIDTKMDDKTVIKAFMEADTISFGVVEKETIANIVTP